MREARREARCQTNLTILVSGIDSEGQKFAQTAAARSISGYGALLSEIEHPLRCMDVIAVQYGGRRARFRVVWARNAGDEDKLQVAVQRLSEDECPWPEELGQSAADDGNRLRPPAGPAPAVLPPRVVARSSV